MFTVVLYHKPDHMENVSMKENASLSIIDKKETATANCLNNLIRAKYFCVSYTLWYIKKKHVGKKYFGDNSTIINSYWHYIEGLAFHN